MATVGDNALHFRLGELLKERKAGVERLAFLATVIIAGATFWLVPRLPMTDLPQHAGQVAAWHDLLLGTSKWESFLYINYFTPYLIGYSLGLVLSFVLPVSAALKVVLTLAYFGFVAACVSGGVPTPSIGRTVKPRFIATFSCAARRPCRGVIFRWAGASPFC